jgi:hypothetical protein
MVRTGQVYVQDRRYTAAPWRTVCCKYEELSTAGPYWPHLLASKVLVGEAVPLCWRVVEAVSHGRGSGRLPAAAAAAAAAITRHP